MTILRALRDLRSRGTVFVHSDAALAATVAQRQQDNLAAGLNRRNPVHIPAKALVAPANGIHGAMRLRPIDALLELARGTALRADREIAAFAGTWAALRYLGLILRDHATDRLQLHVDTMARIGPNQRRVVSEELGVGFGILVAKQWCLERNPGTSIVTATDFDIAVHGGLVPQLTLADRQPDYVLSYSTPASAGANIYEFLETKGTASSPNAYTQLGRAVTQLAAPTIAGAPVTGLAVSTVSTTEEISAYAVDPPERPVVWRAVEEKLQRSRERPASPRTTHTSINLDPDEFLSNVTNTEYASLARYAGLDSAAERWLPSLHTSRRPGPAPGEILSLDGQTYRGSSQRFTLPNGQGQLRVFAGVDTNVADALRSADLDAARQAQREYAENRQEEASFDANTPTNATATSSEGAVLRISLD
ncbi:hypothetical protein [Microbacterium testaceum]|uniref:Uncharacterized protein n=1 Tax=Microbacterium testaceum TaxID=2033 RepID=A0A4Y3QLZ4_MICTE|nr:hypothetical protein [Microbacterium testaceum]MDZ5146026.1 hypothetical protein [Microbacterium testaceum]GEB46284.1 hypothetical protein MTE01_22290 [Microbacterium testaceum]